MLIYVSQICGLLVPIFLLSACSYFKPSKLVIDVVDFHVAPGNESLVIMLPGLGMSIEEYQSQGVVDKIKACNSRVDIVGADTYLAYYKDKTLVPKLLADVIEPAKASGKTHIWLIGTSLGGLGSMIYRSMRPEDLSGIIIMAPYLGEQKEFNAYLAAKKKGSLSDGQEIESSDFVALWENLTVTTKVESAVEITMGFGEQDKFVEMQQWLAQKIPHNKVVTAPGEHKWNVWNGIWSETLMKSSLCGEK